MAGINFDDHLKINGNPDLQERSILEIHKESLRRLFCNSESAFDQWKLALDNYPTKLKKMIMDDFDERFCDANDCFWMFEMKTLPNDWTRKYFCLLVYYAANKNDVYGQVRQEEGWDGWEEKLQTLPTLVQNDVLQSLEKYFYPSGPENYQGIMYDEEVMNSSWVVKFMKLWEWDVDREDHEVLGYNIVEDFYMGDYQRYYELNEKQINGGR